VNVENSFYIFDAPADFVFNRFAFVRMSWSVFRAHVDAYWAAHPHSDERIVWVGEGFEPGWTITSTRLGMSDAPLPRIQTPRAIDPAPPRKQTP
jgi:hypothetical protein